MSLLHMKNVATGRELDPHLVVLSGEAAGQKLAQAEPDSGSVVPLWREVPSVPARTADYYNVGLLKEPVWIWSVPVYFYVGGLAGGGAVLAAVLHGKKRFRDLTAKCRILTFLGTTLEPALLTWDLGRMSRFVNMLRVFRPSSPMSIGSWSLAGTGALAALTMLMGGRKSTALLPYSTAAGGLIVSGYTGVLLGNTANPLWHEKRNMLPLLFTSSSIASTAGVLQLLPLNEDEEAVVRRFGLVGKVGEAACMIAMERSAGDNGEAIHVVKKGKGGVLWNAAKVTLAAGLVLDMMPVKAPAKRVVSGLLTTIGAVCLRFALLETGKSAAREPQATIQPQRRRAARRNPSLPYLST